MYPYERSLVERMKGKPFTIVGVNSDSDREKLKQTIASEKITWPSFWNGGSTEGAIAKQWNVHGWPTIYILDHKGVIRAREVSGSSLDKLLDTLVAEAEKDARAK
jgi:hypothetical protein